MDEQLCKVWLADPAVGRPAYDALLDDVERSRADSFLRPDDRSRFVVGAALVKLAVADGTDLSVAAVRVGGHGGAFTAATDPQPQGVPLALEVTLTATHSTTRPMSRRPRVGPAIGAATEERRASSPGMRA